LDYGVPESHIIGIHHGFRGFTSKRYKPTMLTRQVGHRVARAEQALLAWHSFC
jgi:hypothetical protein